MVSYDNLTISNNFIFTRVMSDPELMKQLLERILPDQNISDLKVVIAEKSMDEFPDTHGIRLDVYGENDEAVFDIEMQVLEKDLPPRRSRYYQSIMDADALRKGEGYKKLKDQYVIFFCLYDPFGDNMMVYTFTNICRKTQKELSDGTTKIYINCMAEEAGEYEALKPFVEYVRGKKSSDPFIGRVDSSVYRARQNARWRKEYMDWMDRLSLAEEDARDEGREEGRKEGLEEGIKEGRTAERLRLIRRQMDSGKSFSQACEVLCLSEAEVSEIRQEFQKAEQENLDA